MSHRFTLLMTCTLLGAVSGCQKENEFIPPPPPTVTVARPIQREVPEMLRVTGQTRATAMVDIRARVDGYLKKIYFEDGADVEEGDLLFEIDPAPFEVALASANAQLLKVKTVLQLAEANLGRTRQLLTQSATTQQQLDVEEAEVAATAAEIATAEAAVDKAKLDLSYTQVRAPLSGRMGRHLVDVGGLVQGESTSLARLESVNPIHVYFYISEAQLLHIMKMTQANEIPDPRQGSPEFSLALGNDDNYRWTGTLDFNEFGIDPGTGTSLRRAIFQNDDLTLVPGLYVRLQTQISAPRSRLLVEERAIGSDQRGEYLLIVNEKDEVEYRQVQLGESSKGLRIVLSGLNPGERVIVNGLQRARPNSKVVPEEAAAPSVAQVPAPAEAGNLRSTTDAQASEGSADN